MRSKARGTSALLALALAWSAGTLAGAQSAPAPAASPLPVIGHTHAKGFCDTVRENVAPSVLGLMKTDELVGASHRVFAKMAQDQTASEPTALQMDRVYLDQVVHAMANNMRVMDKLISDPNRFPKVAHSDDERLEQLLQAQLRAAREQQNAALNQINGIMETNGLADSAGEVQSSSVVAAMTPGQTHYGGTGWVTPNGNNGTGFMGAASLANPGPGPLPDPRDLAIDNTRMGHTVWDRALAAIEVDQTRIAHAEQTLSPTVVAAALGCQPDTPAAPAASPHP
jgi:hypothetical protein